MGLFSKKKTTTPSAAQIRHDKACEECKSKYQSFTGPASETFREQNSKAYLTQDELTKHLNVNGYDLSFLNEIEKPVFSPTLLDRYRKLSNMLLTIHPLENSEIPLPEETKSIITKAKSEIKLLNEFMYDNLKAINIQILEDGVITEETLTVFINTWNEFFSKWKVQIPLSKKKLSPDVNFATGWFTVVENDDLTSYSAEELFLLLDKYNSIMADILKNHPLESTEFKAMIKGTGLYQILGKCYGFLKSAGTYFPRKQ